VIRALLSRVSLPVNSFSVRVRAICWILLLSIHGSIVDLRLVDGFDIYKSAKDIRHRLYGDRCGGEPLRFVFLCLKIESEADEYNQGLTCFRQSVTVNLFCYFREKSEDARRVVLESAYATHMTCVMMWNVAYCVYPWALSEDETWITSCFLTTRQRHELKQWLESHGGSLKVNMCQEFLGKALEVSVSKWFIIPLHSSIRRLRRLVVLFFFLVCY
jgi:hypothetical protein